MIEYKGYIGAIDFDPEIDLFHGTVINTNDVITFYGASVSELREEMQKSIEGYIEFCREQDKISDKPFSDGFDVTVVS
ncbi:type II toxin-antitoxin system HicB family antitoxin [Candidatus Poribacteria bacterium]|nr:type II toxin-antitoxin system HicB family antitoxin [Candidatus Poribacteria bacterium]MYH83106.1 type II toxin-antitoxin system HicB family antitoxin [Candidatus Poribacteria bacterium]